MKSLTGIMRIVRPQLNLAANFSNNPRTFNGTIKDLNSKVNLLTGTKYCCECSIV